MKRCKNITCWTDYPFTELGDISGKKAPIRHVHVTSYDGDKYATVIVDGIESSVKLENKRSLTGILERVVYN